MAARKRESEGRKSDSGRDLALAVRKHRAWPSKIQFWEGAISLYKFFTKSVISGSKCPKAENLEFGDFGDSRILFLEGFIFLYKFFTKSVISDSKRPKSENCEICSCSLVQ